MRRMKSTAFHEYIVAASSSSSEDDLSLGADQEEAPTLTHDAISSSIVSQCKSGEPIKKDDLSM